MWDIRAITEADAELYRARISRGFGRDEDVDETARSRFSAVFDFDRALAAFDGDDIVGTCAALTLGVTVPGGSEVAMAGTTVVTVQPTHRRRGILRALMDAHLDDVAARGEPLAGLWASEGSIYGRFGYGLATFRHRAVIDAPSVEILAPHPEGLTIRLAGAAEAETVVRPLYEEARARRAGMLRRGEAWWTHRIFADPESWRGGKTALRFVLVEDRGHPVGYATYRQKDAYDDFANRGEVHVVEVVTLTPTASEALWRYLTSIDLFPAVEWWNMPVDDALAAGITTSRSVRRTLGDGLWVRVMDVPTALEARSYQIDGEITFDVTDQTRPDASGGYHLVVTDGRAECGRLEGGGAEVELDIDVLGHLYLGGGNAIMMAGAGRIDGEETAVAGLHRMFHTDVAPWCPEVF